jgi:tRNA A-37 threonylcarbamoyl transferase component Bud32
MQAIKIPVRLTVAVATQIGRILAGKYRLEQVLATGGMGTVVAATHQGLGRKVALKFMRLGLADDGESIGRFMREARAAATLRSEHVAQVLDVEVDTEDGAPYIVMEYLEGRDLASLLQSREQLPAVEAVSYVLQACEGLAEAHANGIVHRDLKPANLFLTRRPDGTPLVKVLDFGISKLSEAAQSGSFSLTQPRKALGSPQYMSPEQTVASPEVDQRADIWALGVILYELVSGRPPFSAGTFLELGLEITNRAHAPLFGRVSGLAPGLSGVIDRCLQKTPGSRFADLAAFAAALAPHAGPGAEASAARIARTLGVRGRITQPVAEASPPPVARVSPAAAAPRPAGRRPWLAVAVLAVGVAAAASVMLWRRAATVEPPRASAAVPAAPALVPSMSAPAPAAAAAPVPALSPPAPMRPPSRKSAGLTARKRRLKPEPAPASQARPPEPVPPVPAAEPGATRTRRGPVVTDL